MQNSPSLCIIALGESPRTALCVFAHREERKRAAIKASFAAELLLAPPRILLGYPAWLSLLLFLLFPSALLLGLKVVGRRGRGDWLGLGLGRWGLIGVLGGDFFVEFDSHCDCLTLFLLDAN